MEQGLRMNGWGAPISVDLGGILRGRKDVDKDEWMNECNYRLKKIVIV